MKNKLTHFAIHIDDIERAKKFYDGVFEWGFNSYGHDRYRKVGVDQHGRKEGSVMAMDFSLNDMHFLALNGGPMFKFTEATSIMVNCDTQEEIDYYWSKLTDQGEEGPCGWLKDKYGVSWQVAPKILAEYLVSADKHKVERVTNAFMAMKKFSIAKLKEAYDG